MAGYGNEAGLEAWLTENGFTLPVNAPAPAVLLQRGSAYIDGLYGLRFSGVPTGGFAQERAWPRTGATAYGAAINPDVIPDAVVKASYFAAYQEAVTPGSLSPVATGAGQVKREKVDVIEVEYFGGSGDALANATPTISAVEGLLAPFLIIVSNSPAIGIWAIG